MTPMEKLLCLVWSEFGECPSWIPIIREAFEEYELLAGTVSYQDVAILSLRKERKAA